MASAHHVGIGVFGAVLILLGNVMLNLLGVILIAYSIGHAIKEHSINHHTKDSPKRIMLRRNR